MAEKEKVKKTVDVFSLDKVEGNLVIEVSIDRLDSDEATAVRAAIASVMKKYLDREEIYLESGKTISKIVFEGEKLKSVPVITDL